MKTFVAILALAAVALAAPQGSDVTAETLKFDSAVNADSYQYAYETSNQIKANAEGHLKQIGTESAIAAQGQFQWVSPEGTPISIQYVADENGYQPQGDSLPVAPPVPEAIQRALEYIQAHPAPPQ